jgi:hypothetical protein
MPTTRTAVEVLDRDFLEIRHRLLDIAAALDRMDRVDGAGQVHSDRRYTQLEQAIRVLANGQPDRAERVQMVFSLPYDRHWESALGVGGH